MTSKWHKFMGCDKQFRGRMNQPQKFKIENNWLNMRRHPKRSPEKKKYFAENPTLHQEFTKKYCFSDVVGHWRLKWVPQNSFATCLTVYCTSKLRSRKCVALKKKESDFHIIKIQDLDSPQFWRERFNFILGRFIRTCANIQQWNIQTISKDATFG